MELNWKQSHVVDSSPSVVVRSPDFTGGRLPASYVYLPFGWAWLYFLAVSPASRLKRTPLRETDDTVILLRESTIHTCALIHPHDRFEDSVFRHICHRNMNSALGWGSPRKRFLRLKLDCSLHSHAYTLRADCPLRLSLTRVSSSGFSHFTLGLIITFSTFDINL